MSDAQMQAMLDRLIEEGFTRAEVKAYFELIQARGSATTFELSQTLGWPPERTQRMGLLGRKLGLLHRGETPGPVEL